MKKLTGICFLLMWLTNTVYAQEQLSLKQQADKLYDRYEYFKSLNLYLKIADKDMPSIQIVERVANCYRNINDYNNAETWYAKAVAYPKASKISHLYYAGVLLRDEKFDQAKEQYGIYFNDDPAELALKIAGCDSAKLWMGQPSAYKVENAQDMNSAYSDWGLNYYGKTGFIFTSDRIVNDGVDDRTGNNWFKLYRYDIKDKNIRPIAISSSIENNFSGDYHLGPMALNKTADTAYITITTEVPKRKLDNDKKDWRSNQRLFSRRLQLVIAKRVNDQWYIIESFPYNNIQKYSVSSPALSKDGRLLYFSSDMPGGEGKTDIWYCERQADGTLGRPTNCGKNINTKEEDDFPYLDDNGALYYSSKGPPGMGGYDIYKAKGQRSNWNVPQNLKYPVNTTSDDFYFVTHDGLSGYLSSNRSKGAGSDDIYSFNFSPVNAIAKNVATAKPAVPKPVGTVTVMKNTPPEKASPPIAEIEQGFVFDPIYYDLDKYKIRQDAAVELDKLVGFLKQYPTLIIEIGSYTDSRASGGYNLILSKRRAKAVIDYLTARGIAPNRLVAKWYGKANLVNDCGDDIQCTEAQHQLNRRTEFKILAE